MYQLKWQRLVHAPLPKQFSQVPVVSMASRAEAVFGHQAQKTSRLFLWRRSMGVTDLTLSKATRGNQFFSCPVCLQVRPGPGNRWRIGALMPSGYYTTIQVVSLVIVTISCWRPWGVTARICEFLSTRESLRILDVLFSKSLIGLRGSIYLGYLS